MPKILLLRVLRAGSRVVSVDGVQLG
jgi:hypothetical protein